MRVPQGGKSVELSYQTLTMGNVGTGTNSHEESISFGY